MVPSALGWKPASGRHGSRLLCNQYRGSENTPYQGEAVPTTGVPSLASHVVRKIACTDDSASGGSRRRKAVEERICPRWAFAAVSMQLEIRTAPFTSPLSPTDTP